jgi:ABC-type dipeptide/oligopeptide/nickel transport system permease component
MSLARFLVVRLAGAIVTLLVVSMVVFAAIHNVPGGYEDVVLGPLATPELRAQTAEKYGLDQPIPVQYVKWLSAVVHGDLGTSMTSKTSRPHWNSCFSHLHSRCSRVFPSASRQGSVAIADSRGLQADLPAR